MTSPYLVALQGFSVFERTALGSCLRLASQRTPSYEEVDLLEASQFTVADADHAAAVQAVLHAGRLGQTVFIGAHPPAGATAWMMRPIDPLHLLRELDALVALKAGDGSGRISGFGPLRDSLQLPRGREVLLVDDSEIAQRFLETRLQRMGLHSQRAPTSGKAIDLLAQQAFDFVFLDVELGDASAMDGLALCRYIKHRHRQLGGAVAPVVVLVSAHQSELDRVRGTLAGCDGYLAKPLDEQALRQVLLQHGAELAPAG